MKHTLSLLASASLHAAACGAILGVLGFARTSSEFATFALRTDDRPSTVRIDPPSRDPVAFDDARPQPTPIDADHAEPALDRPEADVACEAPRRTERRELRLPRARFTADKLPPPPSGAPVAQGETAAVETANPPPVYPDVARRRGWEGEVVVLFDVTAEGACANARVDKSSGHASLDSAALAAIREWRYRPATREGAAVASTQRVRFVFKLQG